MNKMFFLNKYDKYKPFITELIEETQLEKIPIKDNNTRPTTRIAGALCCMQICVLSH
jgi:hypothetical protein